MERAARLDTLDQFSKLCETHLRTRYGIADLHGRLFMLQETPTTSESALGRILVYLERVFCDPNKSDDSCEDLSELLRITKLEKWTEKLAGDLDKRAKRWYNDKQPQEFSHWKRPRELYPGQGFSNIEVPEPELPEQISDIARDALYDSINHSMSCVCKLNMSGRMHTGCLQLKRGEDQDKTHTYDIVFAHIYHPETEQPNWISTRFYTGSTLESSDDSRRSGKANPGLKAFGTRLDGDSTTLCEMMKINDGPVRQNLRPTVERRYLKGKPDFSEFVFLKEEAKSLAVLVRSHILSDKSKIALAHRVSWAVWEYYDSSWMRHRWTYDEVCFIPLDSDSCDGHDRGSMAATSPLIKMNFDIGEGDERKLHFEHLSERVVHSAPRIQALGVMLASIFGLSIEKNGTTPFEVYNNQSYAVPRGIRGSNPNWVKIDDKSQPVREIISNAVSACFDVDDPQGGTSSLSERQKHLYNKIVWPFKHLNEVQNMGANRKRSFWHPKPMAPTQLSHHPRIEANTTPEVAVVEPHKSPESSQPTQGPKNDDTNEHQKLDGPAAQDTLKYLEQLKGLRNLLHREVKKDTVRVAILDTGVDLPRGVPSDLKPDRYESHTWIGVPNDKETPHHAPISGTGDPDGHGTHMTSIFLDLAGTCRLYVVQVAGARSGLHTEETNDVVAANIARAIHYAANTWHVDIISMSCGFLESDSRIEHEIRRASEKVLFLAAAGNSGATEGMRWPARHNDVVGINAADGRGNKFGGNPTPNRNGLSFSFVGCAVPGYLRATESTKPRKVTRSGTSHATAVAAATAAIIMQIFRDCKHDFVDSHDKVLYLKTEKALRTKCGMEAIFSEMTQERDGYELVQPWKILPETGVDVHKKAFQIATNIIKWSKTAR